jgi:hypothetical protein
MTQAILAKAFHGELVPTEAELARREGREYAPMSVLLERIKQQRGLQAAGKLHLKRTESKPKLAGAKGRHLSLLKRAVVDYRAGCGENRGTKSEPRVVERNTLREVFKLDYGQRR